MAVLPEEDAKSTDGGHDGGALRALLEMEGLPAYTSPEAFMSHMVRSVSDNSMKQSRIWTGPFLRVHGYDVALVFQQKTMA